MAVNLTLFRELAGGEPLSLWHSRLGMCKNSAKHAYLTVGYAQTDMNRNRSDPHPPSQPFVRAAADDPEIGRAICGRLAELHGWDVRFESEAMATLTIPMFP